MGAQALHLSRLSPIAFAPSRKASSFDADFPHFLKPTSWNPTFSFGSCSISSSRTLSLCALSSQKDADSLAHVEPQNLNPKRKKLAVFVSGGGSNFKAIHAATLNGSLLGDVVVLVTNKADCGGAVYAKENGIPVVLFPKKEAQFSPSDLVTTLRT